MEAHWITKTEKARQVRLNVKVLLTVFFDYHGVVHQEFLPQGPTVNKEYYLEVMRRSRVVTIVHKNFFQYNPLRESKK